MIEINVSGCKPFFGVDSEFVPKDGIPGFACLPPKSNPIQLPRILNNQTASVYEDAVCGEWGTSPQSCFGYLMDAFLNAAIGLDNAGHTIAAGGPVKVIKTPKMYESGCNPTRNAFRGGALTAPITAARYKKMIDTHGACCGTHFHMNISPTVDANALALDLVYYVYPLWRAIASHIGDPYEAIRAKAFYRGAYRTKEISGGMVFEWKDISSNVMRSPLYVILVLGAIRSILACHVCGHRAKLAAHFKDDLGMSMIKFSKRLKQDSDEWYKEMALKTLDTLTINHPNSPWAVKDSGTTYGTYGQVIANKVGLKNATVTGYDGINKDAVIGIVKSGIALGGVKDEWKIRASDSHGISLAQQLFFRGLYKKARIHAVDRSTWKAITQREYDIPDGFRIIK